MINVKKDFPILNRPDKPVVYLDSAATTQKPQVVLDALKKHYEEENANPLRGLYELSVTATEQYELARHKVAKFINAKEDAEIIFTRNASESLNLIAYTYGMANIKAGDEIVISIMEHHSNLLPWQVLAKDKGATLKYLYIDSEGHISDEEIKEKITDKTKIVSIAQVSNVLGNQPPLKKIIDRAHEVGAIAIVDGAQGAPHLPTDVQAMDCDFYVFSGHKMLAPMGIGVLYGKKHLLEEMPPFLLGGEMIDTVSEQEVTYAPVPEKFEAGTPNVAGAIALGVAIDYLNAIGMENIKAHDEKLVKLAMEGLAKIPHVTVYGSKDYRDHCGVISFNIDGVHPHDVSSLLDYHAHVAIRAGNHCAHPLLKFLKTNSTNRASFYLYNTEEDVKAFLDAVKNVRKWMGYKD